MPVGDMTRPHCNKRSGISQISFLWESLKTYTWAGREEEKRTETETEGEGSAENHEGKRTKESYVFAAAREHFWRVAGLLRVRFRNVSTFVLKLRT